MFLKNRPLHSYFRALVLLCENGEECLPRGRQGELKSTGCKCIVGFGRFPSRLCLPDDEESGCVLEDETEGWWGLLSDGEMGLL